MRGFIFLFFLFFILAPNLIAEENVSDNVDYLGVYYFRSNFRCSNCYKIEEYTKESVEGFFEKELSSGELVYKVINIDEKENSHFIEDYQLYTKSVVLYRVVSGEETEYKNLQKIWEYLDDKDKFRNYIKEEINSFLHKKKEEEI